MKKKQVAFICTHNSCRSIIAEGWAKQIGQDVMDAYSAGTEAFPAPKPLALEVMEDAGVDMSYASSKHLADIPKSFDILITMGCGVECPFLPAKHREDWGVVDPSGGSKKDFEETRDIIKVKVLDLIDGIKKNKLS